MINLQTSGKTGPETEKREREDKVQREGERLKDEEVERIRVVERKKKKTIV